MLCKDAKIEVDPVRGAFEECMWFTDEYEGFDDVSFPSALTHLQKSSEFCSLTHIQCDHFKQCYLFCHKCITTKPWFCQLFDRWRQWEAHDCTNMDSVHNDGERHIPYIMFFPDSTRNKLTAWAKGQISVKTLANFGK